MLGLPPTPRPSGGTCCGACALKHRAVPRAVVVEGDAPVVHVEIGARAAGAPGGGTTRRRIAAAGAPEGYTRSEGGRVYRPEAQSFGGRVRENRQVSAGGVYRSAAGPNDRVIAPPPGTWEDMSTARREAWIHGVAASHGWIGEAESLFRNDVYADGPAEALRTRGVLDEPPDPSAIQYPSAQRWAEMNETERRAWARQAAEQQRLSDAQEQRFITTVITQGVTAAQTFMRELQLTERERIRANAQIQIARYTGRAQGEASYANGSGGGTTSSPASSSQGASSGITLAALALLALKFL